MRGFITKIFNETVFFYPKKNYEGFYKITTNMCHRESESWLPFACGLCRLKRRRLISLIYHGNGIELWSDERDGGWWNQRRRSVLFTCRWFRSSRRNGDENHSDISNLKLKFRKPESIDTETYYWTLFQAGSIWGLCAAPHEARKNGNAYRIQVISIQLLLCNFGFSPPFLLFSKMC